MKTFNILIIISIFTGIIISCDSNPNKDEEKHHHDEKLYLTAYSSEYEVYAIASPFVAGQTAEIITHITFLENFKPITRGRVTATLSSGNESVTQTLEEPTHTGIYDFDIQPTVVGTGKLSFKIETESGISTVIIEPIEIYDDEHEAHHAALHATTNNTVSGGNSASFKKEQSWIIDFSTETVEKEMVGQIIRSAGQIKNAPEDERVIPSAMSGIVQFSGSGLFEGTKVTSGQTLFRIDGSAMADNNLSVRFAEAESEYNRAKTEYERKEMLISERIVSESELNNALAEYKSAEANYNNLKKNFTAGSQSITSPISGHVKELLVENGQYVEAGQSVLCITKPGRLIIQTELQPKYFDKLDNITSINFRMVNGEHTYSLKELGGSILSYSRSLDLHNPLITMTIQLDKDIDLIAGSLLEMFLKTEGDQPMTTVPNESIVEEMGNYFVYVQQTPELFEKRLVKKGATDGRRTEIQSGLTAGERVVGKGATIVKLSQLAGSVDVHSGHVH